MIFKYSQVVVFLLVFAFALSCNKPQSAKLNESIHLVAWESDLRSQLNTIADSLTANLYPWEVPSQVFKVEDYGAVADSVTINTKAIQQAIDECSQDGGGIVLFSSGYYVTGTIELRSNVMLEVAEGAVVLGSTDLSDYPNKVEQFKSIVTESFHYDQCLIWAERVENIGIRGKGMIDFRGEKKNFPGPQTITSIHDRPFGIRMVQCKNVVLKDIFLCDAAAWMQHYAVCENLIFDGIKVINYANVNNDGLDLDACKNVIVRNSHIQSEDDAMCMKGIGNRITENILIENSTFSSRTNALKIGTDTQGDFRNIIVRNLELKGITNPALKKYVPQGGGGINLSTVDGADVGSILISNVKINHTRCPIFLRLGNRGRVLDSLPDPGPGTLSKVIIEEVEGVDNAHQGSFISGIASKKIEDIVIRNVMLEMSGGGRQEIALQTVLEDDARYPDSNRFHSWGLPAYGFYIRHAKNITLDNVNVTVKDVRPEYISGGNINNV